MPHAIERLLATPIINPRLPRIRAEISGMVLPVFAGERRPLPMAKGLLPIKQSTDARNCRCNSIHFWEYVWTGGDFLTIDSGRRVRGRLGQAPVRCEVEGGPGCPRSRRASKRQSPLCAAMRAL